MPVKKLFSLVSGAVLPPTSVPSSPAKVSPGPYPAIQYLYSMSSNAHSAVGVLKDASGGAAGRVSDPLATVSAMVHHCHVSHSDGGEPVLVASSLATVLAHHQAHQDADGGLAMPPLRVEAMPMLDAYVDKIRKIVAPQSAPTTFPTVVLLTDGRLLQLVPNMDSDVDATSDFKIVVTPAELFGGESVTDVAVGNNFAAACTTSGDMYTWGPDNTYGQHGVGNVLPSAVSIDAGALLHVPRKCLVNTVSPVVAVACGSRHTLGLTADGAVISFGRGTEGQLGHRPSSVTPTLQPVPKIVKHIFGTFVSSIAAAGDSSAFVASGQLFTFGNNTTGNLGSRTFRQHDLPTKVDMERDEEFDEAAARTTTESPRYGTIDALKTPPRRLPKTGAGAVGRGGVVQLSMGANHTCYTNGKGQALTCGLNTHGQLGRAVASVKDAAQFVPLNIRDAKITECGASHTVIVTKEGSVALLGLVPADSGASQLEASEIAPVRGAKVVSAFAHSQGAYIVATFE